MLYRESGQCPQRMPKSKCLEIFACILRHGNCSYSQKKPEDRHDSFSLPEPRFRKKDSRTSKQRNFQIMLFQFCSLNTNISNHKRNRCVKTRDKKIRIMNYDVAWKICDTANKHWNKMQKSDYEMLERRTLNRENNGWVALKKQKKRGIDLLVKQK